MSDAHCTNYVLLRYCIVCHLIGCCEYSVPCISSLFSPILFLRSLLPQFFRLIDTVTYPQYRTATRHREDFDIFLPPCHDVFHSSLQSDGATSGIKVNPHGTFCNAFSSSFIRCVRRDYVETTVRRFVLVDWKCQIRIIRELSPRSPCPLPRAPANQ